MDTKLLLSLTVNPSEITVVVNTEDTVWLQSDAERSEMLTDVMHSLIISALQSLPTASASGLEVPATNRGV